MPLEDDVVSILLKPNLFLTMIVPASDSVFKSTDGFPVESDFASHVRTLPKSLLGHRLAAFRTMATKPGQVVKLSLERVRYSLERHEHTFVLLDANGQPYESGVYLKGFCHEPDQPRLVLFDAKDVPLALAVQRQSAQHVSFTVYGREPLHPHDKPSEQVGDDNLYPWFQMNDFDESHPHVRALLVWNGHDFHPLWRCYPNTCLPQQSGTGLLPASPLDHKICDSRDPSSALALLSKQNGRWDVCVAPGTDVAAVIMMTAVLEEMVSSAAET